MKGFMSDFKINTSNLQESYKIYDLEIHETRNVSDKNRSFGASSSDCIGNARTNFD